MPPVLPLQPIPSRYLWLLASTATATGGLGIPSRSTAGPVPARPADRSQFEIRSQASLESVLSALAQASRCTVAAEIPAADRRRVGGSTEVPLEAAPRQISVDYHLHPLVRPTSLAFRRRYVEAVEDHGLEVPELEATATDLHRLARPLCPHPLSRQTIEDRITFFRSITPEQMTLMRGQGMPVGMLARDQQMLWGRLNNSQGYAKLEFQSNLAVRLFRLWPKARLKREATGRGSLLIQFPDTVSGPQGFTLRLDVPGAGVKGEEPPSVGAVAGGRDLGSSVNAYRHLYQYPIRDLQGKTTVGAVLDRIESAARVEIKTAPHLRSRRLFLFSGSGSAGSILQALADLYGWQISHQSQRYRVGRPQLGIARDAHELHARAVAALPPQLHLIASPEGKRVAGLRDRKRIAMVAEGASRRLGDQWRDEAVTRLDLDTQNKLAALVFDRTALLACTRYLQRADPPQWLVAPGQGAFTLRGAVGPKAKPLLQFHVPRPDGRVDSWGWYVGTNNLEK